MAFMRYFKKVILFAVVQIILHIYYNNIIFFKNNYIFRIIIDDLSILTYMVIFTSSFLLVLIIKLISLKVDNYIYGTDKLIIYVAVIFENYAALAVLLISILNGKDF